MPKPRPLQRRLTAHQIEFTFHDYRSDGLEPEWLINAEQALGWEQMLNKRGTTFRQLSDEQNINKDTALTLMLEHVAMIKRPILIHNDHYYIGFKADQYSEIFA